MADESTLVQINKQDPAIEAYRIGLLKDVQEFIQNQIAQGMPAETGYSVAGLSDAEQAAIQAAGGGIGAFQPYLQESQDLLTGAAETIQGIGAYNPFEEQVIQRAMDDIGRQATIQGQQVNAAAATQGAFGGSRGAIAQQELNRNTLDQMARTSAQLRQQGFDSAMNRRIQEATLMNQLGLNQAGIGELAQNLLSSQISNALTAGGLERGVEQGVLDATRLTNLESANYPYQQYGFLSDIYAGVPTSQSTVTASSAPQTAPLQTAIGLGISGLSAAAGAQKAGLL